MNGESFVAIVFFCIMLIYVLCEAVHSELEFQRLKKITRRKLSGGCKWKI